MPGHAPPPSVVLFDLDDTLVDHTGAVAGGIRALRPQFRALRHRPVPELVDEYNRLLRDVHPAIVAGRRSAESARRERFATMLTDGGRAPSTRDVDRAIRTYQEAYRRTRERLPGAVGLLRSLRRVARVGVLSNNRRREQEEKLRLFALDRLVDFVMTSEELGCAKPDPEAFHRTLERVGAPAAGAVMVGDSWTDDVEGALAAGMRAVWLNRWGRSPPRAGLPVSVLPAFTPVLRAYRVIRGRDTAPRPPRPNGFRKGRDSVRHDLAPRP